MIVVGKHRERYGVNHPYIRDLIQDTPTKNKEAVLKYMKSEKLVSAAASGIMQDALTGMSIPGDWLAYNDDTYAWDSETIYYFDKYNMILPHDFIEHVLKQNKDML